MAPPVIKKLIYDDANPNGMIGVVWSFNDNAEEATKLKIEYMNSEQKGDDDSKDNDDEHKKNVKSVEIEIEKDSKDGTSNIYIDKMEDYLVQIKCYSEKKQLWSPASNKRSINVKSLDPLPTTSMISIKEKKILLNWMSENVLTNGKNRQLRLSLLYRMTRDGREMAKAKAKYNDKGATLTIIKSRDYNHVCGGYTSKSWIDNGSQSPDANAFIFLLRSQFGHNPQILKPKDEAKAVNYSSSCGPSWGTGCSLRILERDNGDVYTSAFMALQATCCWEAALMTLVKNSTTTGWRITKFIKLLLTDKHHLQKKSNLNKTFIF